MGLIESRILLLDRFSLVLVPAAYAIVVGSFLAPLAQQLGSVLSHIMISRVQYENKFYVWRFFAWFLFVILNNLQTILPIFFVPRLFLAPLSAVLLQQVCQRQQSIPSHPTYRSKSFQQFQLAFEQSVHLVVSTVSIVRISRKCQNF